MTHSTDSRRPRRTRRQVTAAALVLLASVGWARQVKAAELAGNSSAASGTVVAGSVDVLAIDPATPTTLYAGTYCPGVLKSLDGGDSWINIGLTIPYGRVWALAIDPATPTTLYAGTSNWGVFQSLNGASSWQATALRDGNVRALAIDPATPTTLYAGTEAGVFQSTNTGDSWSAVNTGLGNDNVRALAIDPHTPSTLYAGTWGGGVLRSTDSGGSWRATGLTDAWVTALAIDPHTPSTLYVGTWRGGVFRSTNSGSSWHTVNLGQPGNCPNFNVTALVIDPHTPSTLYAGTVGPDRRGCSEGLYKSTDSGGSWRGANAGLPDNGINVQVHGLAIDPTTPSTLYAHFDWVFKSTDAATTWHATGSVAGSICGDGVRACDEECDDGNLINGDGCDANCTLPRCGNGIVDAAEPCDDGNPVNGDDCENDCTLPRCGNGIVDAAEPCDDGNPVNGDDCENDCTLPRCGNGILDAGEECDDGNLINGDGCDANCTLPRCGNGIVDAGEECDDGNRNPFDGCTKACTMCGNGIVTPPEECDSPNLINGERCDAKCALLPRCGNGIVDAAEECDDGNGVNGDGCAVNCTQPRCGNGIVDAAEECDDFGTCIGSANAGDGCAAAHDCPGGTCTTFGGDGCAANCTRESELTFDLVPGRVQGLGLDLVAGTSGAVLRSDILTIPLPFGGSQTLTTGKERNGQMPVVIKAGSVHFIRVPLSNFTCYCPRAIAAKTCGGTVVEPDGVTPSTDCTPGFTAGDSVCAGQKPCAFVHGPGNSASGVIGCDGFDGVNVQLTQDAGGSSGTAGPPVLTLNGAGGPGSALLSATHALGGGRGGGCGVGGCGGFSPPSCAGQDVSVYGPDGEFCTDDDPQAQRGIPVTVPVTTGTATGQLLDANTNDYNSIGPFSVTGAPFRCRELDVAGTALASTFTELATSFGDVLYTSILVASGDAGVCVGDCDADGTVTVTEIITLVNIALGTANVSACTAGDSKHDGQITIDEIIRAVSTALSGCASSLDSP